MKKTLTVLLTLTLALAMCVPAFALDFTESVEVKPAPEIVPIVDGGKEYGAEIDQKQSGTREELVPIYDEDGSNTILEFFVISAAEKESAALPEINLTLTNAEKQFVAAKDFGTLSAGIDTGIKGKIADYNKTSTKQIKYEDLVASDVFDASLVRDKLKLEQVEEGKQISFYLRPNFKKGAFFVLLHNTDGSNWQIVDSVEWAPNGALKVTVDKLSAFAFIVEKSQYVNPNAEGPTSPETGSSAKFRFEYAFIALAFIGIGTFCVVATKRKKHEN